MMQSIKYTSAAIILLSAGLIFSSCSTKKSVKFMKTPVPSGVNVAVIVEAENNHKNVILERFLAKGYNVIAINASDFYSMDNIFDIKDIKKLSYKGKLGDSLVSMERTVNNIYKLHMYNFEVNKAEFINELKTKLKVQYLILLNLNNSPDISWGRAINLNTYELIWVENYPTKHRDEIPDIIEHFIASMSGKQ